MNRLQIVKYPDPLLRQKALPVTKFTPELAQLIEEMSETMYRTDGSGLAAPQIGIGQRIIVWDAGEQLEALINPLILRREGEQLATDGCLSFPGLYGKSMRSAHIVVRGFTPQGRLVTLEGGGRWAIIVQHEIDHLDGVLFIDRVLPDSLYWLTSDKRGHYLETPTTLEEALRAFDPTPAHL